MLYFFSGLLSYNLYHYASYAGSHAQRLLDIQEASDKTKSATEVINAKKQIDTDDDLVNINDISESNFSNDDDNEVVVLNNYPEAKDIPALRKGSMYLMAIAVEMQLPFNREKTLRVEVEELPRFKRIIDKAKSGWDFNNPDKIDDAIVSYR